MEIVLTKLTNERHRLELRTARGVDGRELETRSFLLHDLVHYAVEAAAGIEDGLWGAVSAGATLAALTDRMPGDDPTMKMKPAAGPPGLQLAERLTGPMQSVWHGRLPREIYLDHTKDTQLPNGRAVDEAFLDDVVERIRRLWGQWQATPFRQSMTLHWPAV